MTLTKDTTLDQQVPNSVLKELLSTTRPSFMSQQQQQRVPPLPSFLPQNDFCLPSPTLVYPDFDPTVGEVSQNYNTFTGPLYTKQQSSEFPPISAYYGVTVKEEPMDNYACDNQVYTSRCLSGQASFSTSASARTSTGNITENNNNCDLQTPSTTSDHSVSFTELDHILNCDLTFYDELHLGSVIIKQEPITMSGYQTSVTDCDEHPTRMDYDSDPDSYHSDSDCSEVICSEAVQSAIVKQVKNDIRQACTILALPADPRSWSPEQVRSWIVWTLKHYNLEVRSLEAFKINGLELCLLNEDDFNARSREYGTTLFSQLDMWQNASSLEEPTTTSTSTNIDNGGIIPQPNPMYLSSEERKVFQQLSPTQRNIPIPSLVPDPEHPLSPDPLSPTDSSIDSTSFGSISSCGSDDESEPTSRQTIHLWQFLKTLLLQPQFYGNCIRWLDRKNGIFKIEDSARVAKLWGKRKNRPAMNYDKLSRSIRQYYKKGIIKKTENSKRLVYRFCHPYLL